MTTIDSVADAEGYVARVCFKTGPPSRVGVELEWTVHHAGDPTRPVQATVLRAALGPHAPLTLDPASPASPLSGGSFVTVEPGGQVELSAPPAPSPAHLRAAVDSDIAELTGLLATHGLRLGRYGIDPHRPPALAVHSPRYAAMAHAFAAYGPHGPTMMAGTAGLQVCVDAGAPEQFAHRWRAVHVLGPPLLAAFANSRRHAGRDTGWASARMRAWLGLDRRRTGPVWRPDPPADGVRFPNGRANIGRAADRTASAADEDGAAWARYALAAPLLCVRRPTGDWRAPADVTFADWIGGALPEPPTFDDLAYHLTTLFPPVRPRGYLEVRYLDAQPPGEWFAPVAVLTALLQDACEAERIAAPVADRWETAARCGTADPGIAAAAVGLLELALDGGRLPVDVHGIVTRRLRAAADPGGAA